MNSWDELIKAFETGLIIPDREPEPISYRLHYDESGKITMCSTHNHPTDTKYIEVTQEEFNNYWMYEVKNKQLKIITTNTYNKAPMKRVVYEKTSFPKHAGVLLDHE